MTITAASLTPAQLETLRRKFKDDGNATMLRLVHEAAGWVLGGRKCPVAREHCADAFNALAA